MLIVTNCINLYHFNSLLDENVPYMCVDMYAKQVDKEVVDIIDDKTSGNFFFFCFYGLFTHSLRLFSFSFCI